MSKKFIDKSDVQLFRVERTGIWRIEHSLNINIHINTTAFYYTHSIIPRG